MDYTPVIRAFGFEPDQAPLSLSSYSPVFRLANPDGLWVLKRTQAPIAYARAVAGWTGALAARGIPVVTPAAGFGENPRPFQQDGRERSWVVYPFIPGRAYQGDRADLRAAGALLGKIHAAGGQDFGLKERESVVTVEADEIEADIGRVLGWVERAFPDAVETARALLRSRTEAYIQQALPRLKDLRLPLANCSWDYKAPNLVYRPEGPVLVDPDNAGRIPRVYDLAISALLFHNEAAGPGRVFSADEWRIFLEGYTEHVELNDVEKSNWDDILLCAWMDEALWLLQDDEAGWADGRQAGLLKSLLFAEPATFAL